MRITLEADYAVRIVYCLAERNGRLDAKHIAEHTGVTLRFSLKILRKLVAAGIIRSFKGAQGGYELAMPPDAVTMRMIIETVEGDLALSRCLEEGYVCTCWEGSCAFQKVYDEITEMIVSRLDSVTIGAILIGNRK